MSMNVKTLLRQCETLINKSPEEPDPIILKIKKADKDRIKVSGRIIKETQCCYLMEFNTLKLYQQLTGVN